MVMVVNERPLKKMKRRITADLNDFFMFPLTSPNHRVGPFRNPLQGRDDDPSSSPADAAVVCLNIVEEDVTRSRSIYCDHCRVVGANLAILMQVQKILKTEVNGREGGLRVLSGCHIMDFWDWLCKLLGVRMVSVMDVSKKYGLEYRLLHSIIKGHPWYGDWGYEFVAGSFALTRDAYKLAVSAPLHYTTQVSCGK
ncbi:hypothetical protein ACFX2I_039192 [Malus domestica]